MTDKHVHEEIAPEAQIESALNKTELFLERNGKKLLMALGVVVLLVGFYFGFTHLYKAPREQKAADAAFVAQQLFANGDYEKAMNGDEGVIGFISIADQYATTATGNIANHYIGICLLNTGKYQEAIKYLEKYSTVKGEAATIVNAQNKGLIGDAYAQLANYDKALSYYEKAVSESDNTLTAPYYLFKAGQVYEQLGKKEKALSYYETIKNKYFNSLEAQDIDKYIGRISY